MKRLGTSLLLVLVLLGQALAQQPTQTGIVRWVHVERVIDGDTIEVDARLPNDMPERIRLLGVNAPELSKPGGKEAAQWLEWTVNYYGGWVGISYDIDPRRSKRMDGFGRTLAYVYTWRQGDLCAALLQIGFAELYTGATCSRQTEFTALEAKAKQDKAGGWGKAPAWFPVGAKPPNSNTD